MGEGRTNLKGKGKKDNYFIVRLPRLARLSFCKGTMKLNELKLLNYWLETGPEEF
jgi:hypothetical protein